MTLVPINSNTTGTVQNQPAVQGHHGHHGHHKHDMKAVADLLGVSTDDLTAR